MADRKLKIDIRRGKILELLLRDGKVSVTELSRSLGATAVTIRSDLTALERDGYLLRVQGGALLTHGREERSISAAIPNGREKQAIAQAVSGMVRDGDTLLINSGTTSLCVAEALKVRRHLNIVTNSLAVATCLGNVPTLRVLLLGGVINAQYGFTYGSDVQEQLSRYQADWAVLSVSGISADVGLTTYHAEEAVIDRMMLDGTQKALVAADGSKVGKVGFNRIQACSPKLTLVTDSAGEESSLEALEAMGVSIIVSKSL